MGNNAINIFISILDDSDNILKDIRMEVFKKLNLGEYEQLNEFVKESLEHFSFNVSESNFLNQIKDVIIEEMDKNTLIIKNGEKVDNNLFANNLINQLKMVRQVDFNFDDDFRNLAVNINNKFPLIASDDWYAKLSSKNDQIANIINKYNQDIVETLAKFAPQLASELSALENKANNIHNTAETFSRTPAVEDVYDVRDNRTVNLQELSEMQEGIEQKSQTKQSVNYLSINDFHSKCLDKLTEVDLMFRNSGNDKSEIAKASRQLKSFIDRLDNRVYAGELLKKYEKVSDYAISVIYDQIMFENVPMLKEIYENHESSLDENSNKKTSEPINPNTPSFNAYVGMSSAEIRNLINQNQYYSILHGISKENIAKYSDFINTGYQIIINNFLTSVNNCKTFEERHNAYFELYEIFQNFRDYLPIEQVNQLQEQLNSMQRYLNEQRKMTDDTGVRYNSESKGKQSVAHR